MQFLRDPLFQGASFFISILLLILEYPQHISWLLPLCIIFICLLYIGYKFSPDNRATVGKEQVSELPKNILTFIASIIRNWLTFVAIAVLLLSTILTLRGFYSKLFTSSLPIGCPPQYTDKWVERFEVIVPVYESGFYLRTVAEERRNTFYLFDCINPKLLFPKDWQEPVTILFENNLSTMFEDAGVDPYNQLLEPIGSFENTQSINLNESSYTSFPFQPLHTYFIKVGNGMARLHVYELQLGALQRSGTEVITAGEAISIGMYMSYTTGESERFDELTYP